MEKPPAYWIAKFQNKSASKTSLILLLGQNVTREIITFLTLDEFINFTMTCKKLWRFSQDPCVRIKGKCPGSSALKYVLYQDDALGGQNLSEMLIKGNYSINNSPKIEIQWTSSPQKVFHFVNIKGENYFIGFKDNFINVYEIPSFKNELIKRESWFCPSEIIDAAGFKNKIVASYEGWLGLFVYGRCEDLEYFEDVNCSKLAVEVDPRQILSDLKWFENGHLIIGKSRGMIKLFRSDLELIHQISVEGVVLGYHVPSVKANDFVVYYNNIVKAFKSAIQTHAEISINEHIKSVSSTQYKTHNHTHHAIIIQSDSDRIYKNHEDLSIFAKSFKIDREFLLCLNERSHMIIYDLKQHCLLQNVIALNNPFPSTTQLTYISFLKSIYLTKSDKYYINVYHYKEAAPITFKTPFNKITNQFYIHPFICLSGTRYERFGIMILNLYSYIHQEAYEYTLNYDLPEKKFKRGPIVKNKKEDEEEKKEERAEIRIGNIIRYKPKEDEDAKGIKDKKSKKDKNKKHH